MAHCEADHALWRGELERASSAIQLGLAAGDAAFYAPEVIMLCAAGLGVQAARAEQARAAGDAAALGDALAVGRSFLDRARSAVQPGSWHPNADPQSVHLRAWLAKAEAEATRLEGRSDPAGWQAAVEAFSYGHVYEVARCQWRLAEALLGVGDRDQATVAARVAYETAVRLGAEPLRVALEALARPGRLDLGSGVPTQRSLAGLTARELEVLRLLVEGRSNRQIAEQLLSAARRPACM